jgi:hypothetical protein
MRDEETLAEIEDFLEGFNQPTYRGMRVNGVRVATWSGAPLAVGPGQAPSRPISKTDPRDTGGMH